MPVDSMGYRADLIKSPESVVNRMNIGLMYEQYFNRAALIIVQRIKNGEIGDVTQSWNYVLEYINMINPNQVILMQEVAAEIGIEQAVQCIVDEGLYLIVPPTLNTISEQLVLDVSAKFNIQEVPITYNKVMRDGTKKKIILKNPGLIGPEYIYLLGKIPRYQLSAIEMGFVSQFQIPHKLSSKNVKNQSPIGQTAIRLGEDETSLMLMALGVEPVSRYMGLNANSPKAVTMLQEALLNNKYPSKLKRINMSTKEIIENNNVINLFNHQISCCGIEVGTTRD